MRGVVGSREERRRVSNTAARDRENLKLEDEKVDW